MGILRDVIRDVIKPVLVDVSARFWERSPITLKFVYAGVTQYNFKFKAPSTSTLNIYDGDGTMTEVAGNNVSLVTHTTSYVAAGTYYFYVEGDIADITDIRVGNQIVTGSINGWGIMVNLTYIGANNCDLYGRIETFSKLPSLASIFMTNTLVKGDVSVLRVLSLTDCVIRSPYVRFLSNVEWNSCSVLDIGSGLASDDVDKAIHAFRNFSGCNIGLEFNQVRTEASNEDLLTCLENDNFIMVAESTIKIPVDVELHTDANAASDPNGNEADATTGWEATGLSAPNEFISQSEVKNTGSFAFKVNSTPNPTSGANILKNFSTEVGGIYRSAASVRHIGVGEGYWGYRWDGKGAHSLIYSEQTDFIHIAAYLKGTGVSTQMKVLELGVTNDGGLYVDNISVRKVPNVPIILKVEYTTTQFAFKFKAPSTSTLQIYDGDGTITAKAGNDGTLVTHNTSYAAPGTYYFYVEGDYLDITYLDIRNQAFISGDLTKWNTLLALTFIQCYGTGIYGDITLFSDLLDLETINLGYLIGITGDITGWSVLTSLTGISLFGIDITGDISGFVTLTSLARFLISATGCTGDFSLLRNLPLGTQIGVDFTNVTYDTSGVWAPTIHFYAHDCGWSSTMVNQALIDLAAGTISSKTIRIDGNNDARTSASDAAVATLLGRSNTLEVNE